MRRSDWHADAIDDFYQVPALPDYEGPFHNFSKDSIFKDQLNSERPPLAWSSSTSAASSPSPSSDLFEMGDMGDASSDTATSGEVSGEQTVPTVLVSEASKPSQRQQRPTSIPHIASIMDEPSGLVGAHSDESELSAFSSMFLTPGPSNSLLTPGGSINYAAIGMLQSSWLPSAAESSTIGSHLELPHPSYGSSDESADALSSASRSNSGPSSGVSRPTSVTPWTPTREPPAEPMPMPEPGSGFRLFAPESSSLPNTGGIQPWQTVTGVLPPMPLPLTSGQIAAAASSSDPAHLHAASFPPPSTFYGSLQYMTSDPHTSSLGLAFDAQNVPIPTASPSAFTSISLPILSTSAPERGQGFTSMTQPSSPQRPSSGRRAKRFRYQDYTQISGSTRPSTTPLDAKSATPASNARRVRRPASEPSPSDPLLTMSPFQSGTNSAKLAPVEPTSDSLFGQTAVRVHQGFRVPAPPIEVPRTGDSPSVSSAASASNSTELSGGDGLLPARGAAAKAKLNAQWSGVLHDMRQAAARQERDRRASTSDICARDRIATDPLVSRTESASGETSNTSLARKGTVTNANFRGVYNTNTPATAFPGEWGGAFR